MSSTENPCSVGILKGQEIECHKITFVKSCGFVAFESLQQEDKQRLLYRADLVNDAAKISDLCLHHKALIIDRYEVLQKSCCDPFNSHRKRKIKSHLQVISLEFAQKLREHYKFNVVPGSKVCNHCKLKLNKLEEKETESQLSANSTDNEEIEDLVQIQLNTSFNRDRTVPNKITWLTCQEQMQLWKKKTGISKC